MRSCKKRAKENGLPVYFGTLRNFHVSQQLGFGKTVQELGDGCRMSQPYTEKLKFSVLKPLSFLDESLQCQPISSTKSCCTVSPFLTSLDKTKNCIQLILVTRSTFLGSQATRDFQT